MEMDIVAVVIAGFAMLISYFNYKENKKMRIEHGRAFLSMELSQTKDGLFAVLSNIGNTYAYGIKVLSPSCFTNGFENLDTIRPGDAYRFLVLNGQNISDYPENINFEITYYDYYSPNCATKKVFCFNLLEHKKFRISYNQEFRCYDITKPF